MLGAVLALIGVGVVRGIGLPTSRDAVQTGGKAASNPAPKRAPEPKNGPNGPQQRGQPTDGEGFQWQQDKASTPDDGSFGFGYDKLCRRFRAPSPVSDPEQEALRTSLKRQCGYVEESRAGWHLVDKVIETMEIQPGDVIADIGCASGFHTNYLSRAVGPRGTVYAIDLDRVALAFLAGRISSGVFLHNNVQPLISKPDSVLLPQECLDWAFLCGVHFYARPGEETDRCVASIFDAVKPGGRLAMIEATAHVELDKVMQDYLKAGFQVLSGHDFLLEGGPGRPEGHPPEHFIIFKRPED